MNRTFQLTMARWCFELLGEKWSLDRQCAVAHEIGCTAIDLAPTSAWPKIFENGLKVTCSLPDFGEGTAPFELGFCSPETAVRERVWRTYRAAIDDASQAEVPYVIVFTGMKCDGASIDHCVRADGFPKVVQYASGKNVGLVLAALNTVEDPETWRGHPGYFGDRFEMVAKIVTRTNQGLEGITFQRFGLVLDPYHQHLMGDSCFDIIEQHHGLIDILHLAGVMKAPPAEENRCEIHLAGQQVDYAGIADHFGRKGKRDMPVMCDWIPQLPDATEGVKEAAKIFSA